MATPRGLTKRKKVKKTFSRRLHTTWAGCPIDSFWAFKDHARMEIDKKEVAKTLRAYVRENFKKEKETLLAAPEWAFTMAYYVGATIEWEKLGHEFPEKWDAKGAINRYIDELRQHGKRALEEKPKTDVVPEIRKPSIAEIIANRTRDFIGAIEEVIDDFYKGIHIDIENYSVFNELQKVDAPYNMAKSVYDYYTPILAEAEEINSKKCPADLAEGYSHWNAKKKREYEALLKAIVADAESYMLSKKAKRAVRIAKPQTADKQVKSFKYAKDSAEFKLTSINPVQIIGAQRLYTFNVKSRMLTEYLCKSGKGFEVKGSTLQHVDDLNSRQVRLRKPEEMLPTVLKKQPKEVEKVWKTLTTKTSTPNARINKDTIILRVLDK